MDLSLTPAQDMLRTTVQDFVRQEYPKERLLELDKTDAGCTPQLWSQAASLGWLGMVVPQEYGGEGASLTDAAVLFQELGRGPVAGPHFSSSVAGALMVIEGGTEAQRRELLPAICKGETVLALGLTEPQYGWGSQWVRMSPHRQGRDFVLNGVKLFVHEAMMSTHLLCAVQTGGSNGAEDPVSLLVVDSHSPGVSIRKLSGFMTNMCQVTFEDVHVPASDLLGGQEGGGWGVLERALQRAMPVLCAYQVGSCEAVYDMSVSYSRTRVQFGQPVGRFQRVQDHIINLVNHLDAARWTTYEALWKLDADRPATDSVHLAKAVTAEGHHQACNYAHEVHAGVGSMIEYGLALHTKMSRTLYSYLGDPRYHRQRLARAIGL